MAKETKRIVGGQVREVTLQELAQNSVEVTRNAKGEYTFAGKIYCEDGGEPQALERLHMLHERFMELFQPGPPSLRLSPAGITTPKEATQ